MKSDVRLSPKPSVFNDQMIRTDELQLKVMTPPSTLRYTLWHWTAEESAAWSMYREKSESLYGLLCNPDTVGPTIRKKMKELIKEVRTYDNDKANGHHLLDKVALFGTIDDCLTFNVKGRTVLAADPTHHSEEAVTFRPSVTVLNNEEGMQLLSVINPDTPGSKKLPEGMAFARLYRFIGTEMPQNLKLYDYVGIAKKGEYLSTFGDLHFTDDKRVYAFYFARYESKQGVLGEPSAIVKAEILLVNS
jgi:hypothetical protein